MQRMSDQGIDRASPLPYYHQLKALVRADIGKRDLSPGERLPGDHDLCTRYDVSRTVVRQALAELEFEGVIERVKGRGTFVAARRTPQGLVQSLTGLFEDVAARGLHLHSRVRRLEVVPADAQVAHALALRVGAPVVLLERLRFVSGEPWVFVTTSLPAHLVPGLVDEDLSDRSLYAVLDQRYGLRPARGRRSVEARPASTELARDLQLRRGAPVLALSSTSTDVAGRPIETFHAFHRGDRSRFDVELVRQEGAAATPLVVIVEGAHS